MMGSLGNLNPEIKIMKGNSGRIRVTFPYNSIFVKKEIELSNSFQSKGYISDVNFRYTTLLGEYPQLTVDINKLGEIK